MKKLLDVKNISYFAIIMVVVFLGKEILDFTNTLTYKIVVVFIVLIIISNCLAKLYARIILEENI